jgi:hypothetical protein
MKNEAALVERLMQLANPTGGKHTPTPWKAHDQIGVRPETAITFGGGYAIRDGDDSLIALFARREDRDLALYFANTHAAIIGYLRALAHAFDFIAAGLADESRQQFARTHAEQCRIYADLFTRLGKPESAP